MPNEPRLETKVVEDTELRKTNRRAFLTAALAGLGGVAGFYGIRKMELDRGTPWLLRRLTEIQDSLWKSQFDEGALSPAGKVEAKFRVNGLIGLEKAIDTSTWKLSVIDPDLDEPSTFSIEEIKAMPAVTEAFEFKCIEGWSQAVECRGVRMSEFMRANDVGLRGEREAFPFARFTSVNGGYYVAMDGKSLLHPQTLLCYEINGEPLTPNHGYPLRLMTSVKYGVKSIKQIGSIEFGMTPPSDYWAENGYGDYLGL